MTLFHLISLAIGLSNLLVIRFIVPFQSLHFGFVPIFPTPFNVVMCSIDVISIDIFSNTLKPSFHVFLFLIQFRIIIILSQSWYPFCVIHNGYIKALMRCVASYWHKHIIQKVDLETPLWYLATCIHQWKFSSLSKIGLHHWPSTKIFCVVVDFNSFIHTIHTIL